MLTEKQLFELIKALQTSNISVMEIFYLCFALIVASLLMSYLVSTFHEKGKITAINANYETLRKQLSINTSTIKNIEKKISSELWISQQIWQKKYDLYETIYAQLFNIKKWVDNEFHIIELHMTPYWIANSYQPYFNEEQEKHFYKEIQQAHTALDEAIGAEDFQVKNNELQQKLSNAMTSLAEVLITRAILLNENITVILETLISSIGFDPSPTAYEQPDEYGERIKSAINTALQNIKNTAISDLQIKHPEP
ncbi:hypothetical protein [Proteus vulgaris]|uniref:Uncharacterized protein n=1 Tax=Proteus vulgaris TaxID=585 RepID=A0A6G6SGT3_PROVU|nr:hypothetical protein [Proteus vulgaris]QIF93723.1 hypothetical protein GTH24_07370 [Proteus vulgaris]